MYSVQRALGIISMTEKMESSLQRLFAVSLKRKLNNMSTNNNEKEHYTIVSGGSFGSGIIDLRNLDCVRVSNCTLARDAKMFTSPHTKLHTVRVERGAALEMNDGYLQHAGIVSGMMSCFGSADCTFLAVHESGRLAAYGSTSLANIQVYDGGHMALHDDVTAYKVELGPKGTAVVNRTAQVSQVCIASGATMTMYDSSYVWLVEIQSGGSLVLLDHAAATEVFLHSGGNLSCCDNAEYSYHRDTPTKLPSTQAFKHSRFVTDADFFADGRVVLKIPDLAVKGGTMSIVIEGKDSDAEKV